MGRARGNRNPLGQSPAEAFAFFNPFQKSVRHLPGLGLNQVLLASGALHLDGESLSLDAAG